MLIPPGRVRAEPGLTILSGLTTSLPPCFHRSVRVGAAAPAAAPWPRFSRVRAMRARLALFSLVVGLLGAGCSIVENSARVACYKVRETIDDAAERHRNRRWAEEAWDQF